jgi:hypothetical protein
MDVAAAVLVVLFSGIFLAFDPTSTSAARSTSSRSPYRIRFGEVLGAMGYTLRWWLIGQGVTMT